jgi:hypothetical protein
MKDLKILHSIECKALTMQLAEVKVQMAEQTVWDEAFKLIW